MDGFFPQLFEILTTPPGNLIYHLILAFAVGFSLQAAAINRRNAPSGLLGRLLLGLVLILTGQVILFASSGLAWQELADSHTFLPPLDRAVTAFGFLWLVWVWAVPQRSRLLDAAAVLLSLLILVFAIYTLSVWGSAALLQPSFNFTWYDWVWELTSLAILLGGLLLVLIRRPLAWGIGFSFLLLNLAGLIVQLFWPVSGDYAAPVRLAQLCTYPLLPLITQRLHAQPASISTEEATPTQPPAQIIKRTQGLDPRAVHAWLLVANETDPQHIYQSTARAIAQTMLADMCLFISKPDRRGEMAVLGGYDLVREEDLPSGGSDQSKLPNIASAIQRNRILSTNPTSQDSQDLKQLANLIGLKEVGNLLALPIGADQKTWGAMLLLSPYSNRVWTEEDQGLLASSASLVLQVLTRGTGQENTLQELKQAQMEIDSLRTSLQQLNGENQRLLQGQANPSPSSAPTAQAVDIESLLAIQNEAQETIAALQTEMQRLQSDLDEERLKSALASSSTPDESESQEMIHLEMELRLSLQQVAQLQNLLADANIKIVELERQAAGHVAQQTEEEREMITSLVQDIRQPLSSIIGYTELILSETVGILGALQRKFVERIRFSTERMRSLLDELVRLTILPGMQAEIRPSVISMNNVLDYALAETSNYMREKKITLRVNLPEELPSITADEDSIQQILIQLLQNATSATPHEGTISLNFQLESIETGHLYLLMQVTDSGGGIAADDLPRVFERRYRAEHPLIQGVGDNGIGLSIAKALVDAHDGRIWVDCAAGVSSTFSVLLPIKTALSVSEEESSGIPAKE